MEVMTSKNLGQLVATTTAATLYQATGLTAILKEVLVCNASDTEDDAFTLHLVGPGAEPAVKTPLLYKLQLAPGETRTIADCSTVIEDGWKLVVTGQQAGAASHLAVSASGVEVRSVA